MSTSAAATADRQRELAEAFPVFDLHTHPTLKSFLFGRQLYRNYPAPAGFMPLTLRNSADAWRAGGVGAVIAACYVIEKEIADDIWPLQGLRRLLPRLDYILAEPYDDNAREQLNELVDQLRKVETQRGPILEMAMCYSDVARIRAAGKTAVINGMEGAHHLNGQLDNLQEFYDRGVCQLIVAHLYPNEACSCVDAFPPFLRIIRRVDIANLPDPGWSAWGKELIERMLHLGMLVDLTHTTPKLRREAYELARHHPVKRPLLMSHVGVAALKNHPMNPDDSDIRAIADTGGCVGIIAMGDWLHAAPHPPAMEMVKKTIDHLIQHGGEDCVAFGSDFDGFTSPPRGWSSPRDYTRVRAYLLEHYTEDQVRKFLFENADRTLRLGWGRQ